MKKYFALFLSLLILSLSGCAGFSTTQFFGDTTVQVAARIAIQYGTMKFIDDDADRAARVIAFVDAALVIAEADSASIGELSAQIQGLIPYDKFDSADRVLIASLSEAVVIELTRRVDVSPETPLADIREVLGWVKLAAELSAPAN